METKEIALCWEPIRHYKEFVTIESSYRAIYIWGFGIPAEFKPYYVGKTHDLRKRICEHLYMLMGGAYNIYDRQNLNAFKSEEYLKYSPDALDKILHFIDNYEFYKPHLNEMIKQFYFTYANVQDKEHLSDLEKSVIMEIGKNNLGNFQGGSPILYKHVNRGDDVVIKILEKYKS